jgi:hypothetical protein
MGGLSEDPLPNAMLGELFHAIVSLQFIVLRDGDRFWYENILRQSEIVRIKKTRLSDIIRQNTTIGAELDHNVFIRTKHGGKKKH